jgi:hypothetical protein
MLINSTTITHGKMREQILRTMISMLRVTGSVNSSVLANANLNVRLPIATLVKCAWLPGAKTLALAKRPAPRITSLTGSKTGNPTTAALASRPSKINAKWNATTLTAALTTIIKPAGLSFAMMAVITVIALSGSNKATTGSAMSALKKTLESSVRSIPLRPLAEF